MLVLTIVTLLIGVLGVIVGWAATVVWTTRDSAVDASAPIEGLAQSSS